MRFLYILCKVLYGTSTKVLTVQWNEQIKKTFRFADSFTSVADPWQFGTDPDPNPWIRTSD
jgi:hypothetical protein